MLFRFLGNIAAATLPSEFSDELACYCHLTIVAEFAPEPDGATNFFCDRRTNGHAISTSVLMRNSNGDQRSGTPDHYPDG